MLMMGVQVDGLRKHPNGRVDQLEDRYLGMVEAPSSNLGTSTPLLLIEIDGVERAPQQFCFASPWLLARHVRHSIASVGILFATCSAHGSVRTVWCSQTVGGSVANFTTPTALR